MNKDSTIKGYWSSKEVFIDDKRLDPSKSQKVHNHSPDGFNWGYGGSGPAQLALSLTLEVLDTDAAILEYQNLKWEIIAQLPESDFEIRGKDVISCLTSTK